MDQHALANALRQRQYAQGKVPRALIDAVSDAAIIDAYITCSGCGHRQVTPSALQVAIFMARDAEGFLNVCDQMGSAHP